MTKQYLLAIDQGTSSSRAVIYDEGANAVASAQQEFRQIYPKSGWVEHDPEEIWTSVSNTMRDAIGKAGITPGDVTGIGITNQRETTLVWDRRSGKCIYNAIVWQDRRTAERCRELRERHGDELVAGKTGLRLDPYFSATKAAWILDNVEGARRLADDGHLAFGTVDSFLLWRLTDGAAHATDATNASRTMLFNIHTQRWDDELLQLLQIPQSMLPEVLDCAAEFGSTTDAGFGAAVPVCGIAGDQQAALIGQAGFDYGMTKSTYGTGCFVIANTGDTALASQNHLLTTIASRIGGKVTYGLEGSVFVAGSALQWLRDELRIIDAAPDSERVAKRTGIVDDVYVVPAFAGLGAPYWDPDARGAIFGITRDTGPAQLVRATLESVCYQTFDLLEAKRRDGLTPTRLRVDGGMVQNNWLCQFLADLLGIVVERPAQTETSALGAAYLSGLQVGLFNSLDDITAHWQVDQEFDPAMENNARNLLLADWHEAVIKVKTNH